MLLTKIAKWSWWRATGCSCAICFAASNGAADGLIMTFDRDGSFGATASAPGFAKHYSTGGVRIQPLSEERSAALEEPDLKLRASPRGPRPRAEILQLIQTTALRYGGHQALRGVGLSPSEWALFFQANIEIESAYNPDARSHAGAIGLGQLMPDTARMLRVDPNNIAQNLDGSARYLLMRLEQFGSKELALAAYNAGAEAVIRHGGIPPFRETIGHVQKVMAVYNRLNGEPL